MANTYTLIASNTLTSDTASVTFSSIPNTYTDLVLKMSVRNSRSATTADVLLRLNNDTNSIYSYTYLDAYGGTVSSSRSSADNIFYVGPMNASTSTSNTFTSVEIYIPSYTASQNKPLSGVRAFENNSTADWAIQADAFLFRSTTAISSIQISASSSNYVSGSSFWLYGIKKD